MDISQRADYQAGLQKANGYAGKLTGTDTTLRHLTPADHAILLVLMEEAAKLAQRIVALEARLARLTPETNGEAFREQHR